MESFEARVAALDAPALTRLLTLRPELHEAGDLRFLARYLELPGLATRAVRELPSPQRQLLEAACLLGAEPRLEDLHHLDPDVEPGEWRDVADDLRSRLLLIGEGDALDVPRVVQRAVVAPLGLGRPAQLCFQDHQLYWLNELLARHGAAPARSRDAARRALAQLLEDPGHVGPLLARLPAGARDWLDRAAHEGPVLTVKGLDVARDLWPEDPDLLLLLDLALLAVVGTGRVELPGTLGYALRAPRVHAFRREVPDLARPEVPDAAVRAGEQVARLLDLVEQVLARVDAAPLPLLSTGGVGVREVRGLAAAVGAPVEEVATVLALAGQLGLLVAGRKDVRVTTRFPDWSAQEDAPRWSDLVRAWLTTSAAPVPVAGSGRRLKAVLGLEWDRRPREVREQLRRVLLEPGPVSRDWAAQWDWRFPPVRRSAADPVSWVPDEAVRQDALAEARLLGLLVEDAVTPLAGVLEGAAPDEVLARVATTGVEQVRAQADLTLVCTGRPSRRMRTALDALATVESTGAATVWRLSETSLAPAFDDGSTPEDVLALLERYAGELPQPMAYLVRDAHRRHGRVLVGAAGSYAVVADDAALQDALRRRGAVGRRTSAAGLRRVAPTVAVADVPAGDLLALLRDLGLAAVADGSGGVPSRAPATKRARAAGPVRLAPLVPAVVDPAELARRLLR